jgi:two-component system, OmpR family, alkaline phosphatase synthesis response regulator PhoP
MEYQMARIDTQTRTKHTVLVVDDNEQNRELLEAYLEDMAEVRVTSANNGIEALEMIEKDPPELILLDIMMPKMSGFEVCKRIKADPKTRDIVVIMVTALNETSDVERAAECGTDDYLTKPIDRKALIEQIRSLLAAKTRGG